MLELLFAITLLGAGSTPQQNPTQTAAQTTPPGNDYTRFEMREVAQYRQRGVFTDPYASMVVAPVATIDTTSQRVTATYQASDAINRLVLKMIEQNLLATTAQGFRIQLFTGARDAANSVKYEALSLFPDQSVYSVYERPYFKVRIGDFLTEATANRVLRTVRETYSGAFVVPEEVNLKK
jgi:hypothetical protein